MRYFLLLILSALSMTLSAQTFSEFITYVNSLPETSRSEKTDSLLSNTPSFPITEEGQAHFIYNGSGSNVQVAGDFTGWTPANSPLTQVAGTEFWYRTEAFDNEARLDYKIVYNGSQWILDPLNPYTAPGGFGSNSELRMPAYIPPTEILYNGAIPHGTVESTSFTSSIMGDTRTIQVYTPPGYASTTDDYPMVLVHDGGEYLSFAQMDNVLDHLIAEGSIPPMIAVFVPPVDRTEEYVTTEQEDFSNFIITEVLPWIEEDFRILAGPENKATMGSSNGGNISLWLAGNYWTIFGKAAPFSPYIEPDIINGFQSAPNPVPVKIYMNHGSYDHLDPIHESVEAFLPILQDDGYDYLYEEYPEGHSYGFWRAHIDDALIFLFGQTTGLGDVKEEEQALNIHPNPLQVNSSVDLELAEGGHLTIKMYNPDGQLMDSLDIGQVLPGRQQVSLSKLKGRSSQLRSGVYFFCAELDGRSLGCAQAVNLD